MPSLRHILLENQLTVICLGLMAGFFAPEVFVGLRPHTTVMLQIVFLFSSLRLDAAALVHSFRDFKLLIIFCLASLFLLPAAVFLPLSLLAPQWALPFLIVLAGPTGITVQLLAEFFGGRAPLALTLAVVTSLLAPFTMPLVFRVLTDQSVRFDPFALAWSLVQVIVLPFLVALFLRSLAQGAVIKGARIWQTAGTLLFGLLTATIVSETAVRAASPGSLGLSLSVFVALFFVMLLLGFLLFGLYRVLAWRERADRLTALIAVVYVNFTLALWIGDTFFADANVVPKLVVIELMLAVFLPCIKAFGMVPTKTPA